MTRLEIAAGVLPHYATTSKTFKEAAEGALSYADALLAAAGESIIQVSEEELREAIQSAYLSGFMQEDKDQTVDNLINSLTNKANQ